MFSNYPGLLRQIAAGLTLPDGEAFLRDQLSQGLSHEEAARVGIRFQEWMADSSAAPEWVWDKLSGLVGQRATQLRGKADSLSHIGKLLRGEVASL